MIPNWVLAIIPAALAFVLMSIVGIAVVPRTGDPGVRLRFVAGVSLTVALLSYVVLMGVL